MDRRRNRPFFWKRTRRSEQVQLNKITQTNGELLMEEIVGAIDNERDRRNSSSVQEINCPICLEPLRDPVTTVCNHTFCKTCFLAWRVIQDSCAVCRQKLPSYKHFSSRRATLERWTGIQDKDVMADNGFYAIGIRDLVRCAYCSSVIGSWGMADHPWKEHFRFSPRCPKVIFHQRYQQENDEGEDVIDFPI